MVFQIALFFGLCYLESVIFGNYLQLVGHILGKDTTDANQFEKI